jgi:hypothetical protein
MCLWLIRFARLAPNLEGNRDLDKHGTEEARQIPARRIPAVAIGGPSARVTRKSKLANNPLE